MKKFLLLGSLSVLVFFGVSAEEIINGRLAHEKIPNAEVIRYKDGITHPVFVKFIENKGPELSTMMAWIGPNFVNDESFEAEIVSENKDHLGFTHLKINQLVGGVPVEMATIIAHVKNGRLYSINGYAVQEPEFSSFLLSEEQSLKSALNQINAITYKWEMPGESNLAYYPSGQKVYLPSNFDFNSSSIIPCYKYNIYAENPVYRANVYVNASSGEIVFEDHIIKHVDSAGIAITSFSGSRNIITDYDTSGTFTLEESGRGGGIFTYDMLNGTNTGNAVSITNNSNYWPDTLRYRYATDAHWGAEQVYDYYLSKHSRNSIDGNGFPLVSYVHYGQNYNNAFWNGQAMHYGDGNGSSLPYTTLDICGHEVSHGLTSNTAGLIYSYESGALNESFSDIFGCAIEIYAKPDPTKNWLMGEDRGSHIRSMVNPNQRFDPDTYLGDFWFTGAADNGGVHTNSGVQNYWFYLLTNGGSGTNDINNAFSVTGLGITKAESIAFRNLVTYLTQSSDYSDARFYSAQAAIDLYGPCSPELEATIDAWYAVGVGSAYLPGVVSDFTATRTSICALPAQVDFTNLSNINAQTYVWDFGDGQTSTTENPSHIYRNAGNYTVKLTANSNNCGNDTKTITSYITVTPPDAAQAADVVSCTNYPAKLTATGTGQVKWYGDTLLSTVLHIGNTFVTPTLNQNATYYAQNTLASPSKNVGPDTIIGFGAYFNNYQYQVFDVYDYMTLESVVVFSNSAQSRTIELRDDNGQILKTKTVFITKGTKTVPLDFDIAPGYDYQLGVSFGSTPDLFRFSSGTNYPYTLGGLMSITKSSANTDPTGYYYFFFDWSVRAQDCQSALTPVNVTMDNSPGCQPFWTGVGEVDDNFEWLIYPNPAGNEFTLEFTLKKEEQVYAELMDLSGKQVSVLVNTKMNGGLHRLDVNTSGLANGMYLVRLVTETDNQTQILSLTR
ncbi:MAG: M4 family metallopeptidase [Vicingaceae bacterium]